MVMLGNFLPSKAFKWLLSITFTVSMAVMFVVFMIFLLLMMSMMFLFSSFCCFNSICTWLTFNRWSLGYWLCFALHLRTKLLIFTISLFWARFSLSFFTHQDIIKTQYGIEYKNWNIKLSVINFTSLFVNILKVYLDSFLFGHYNL